MLHAAAMLIGIFLLALMAFAQRDLGQATLLAASAAAICVLFGARFGGLGHTVMSAPQALVLGLMQTGTIVSGALKVMRSAIAADVTLEPALVRVKARAKSGFARAVLADLVSSAPGSVVVAVEADAALVHVTDEDAIDAAEIGALEARVVTALDGGARL
jgi:multisubunit Na+/H+ antiporter MnhE subunit